MRVLVFTGLFPSSADPAFGIFVYQRVAHLAKRPGNSIEVVAPICFSPGWLAVKNSGAPTRVPTTESFGGLSVHHPKYFLIPKISMPLHAFSLYRGALPLVRRLHAEAPFDCIDSHFLYPDGCAAVLLGRKLGIPVSVSARGTDINSYPSYKLIRPMIRWTLLRADVRVAVALSLKEKMLEVAGRNLPIHVISNGIDTDRFWRTELAEARRTLGLADTQRIVVSVGSLTEVKRQELLIEAFWKIASQNPDIALYIFGEGPCRSGLEQQARKYSLENRIHLPGKIPNETLRLWYNAADVSCLTSAREGWPNALTESLACGTPVVATRVGGVPEIVTSPGLGILVEGQVDSVAAGLKKALETDWDRGAISSKTRERSWDVVASEVEAVLAEKIDASGHAGKKLGKS